MSILASMSAIWLTTHSVALNHLLLNDIIIADLAGDNDCNKHRVRLTQNYAKNCQVTIMVDEIKRAAENESFMQRIYETWRRRCEDSVVVVLTHTDMSAHLLKIDVTAADFAGYWRRKQL
jgi:proteasome lid subunit RPN8/RPN11